MIPKLVVLQMCKIQSAREVPSLDVQVAYVYQDNRSKLRFIVLSDKNFK